MASTLEGTRAGCGATHLPLLQLLREPLLLFLEQRLFLVQRLVQLLQPINLQQPVLGAPLRRVLLLAQFLGLPESKRTLSACMGAYAECACTASRSTKL